MWAPVGRSARCRAILLTDVVQKSIRLNARKFSSLEAIEKKNHLFNIEKQRQIDNVGRIEKIEVKYLGVPKDLTIFMNKDLSTPYDCARHMSANQIKQSVLALIDGQVYWDMHRPFTDSCSLELLNFRSSDPVQVNKAYWRTCSFMLGAMAVKAFKDNVVVKLHSFPTPDIKSGSFVYDVELQGCSDWEPSEKELRILSAEFVRLAQNESPLERLSVSKDLALLMFEDNEHKSRQIPDIAQKNEGQVTLYRAGDHIDISKGPMVANTNLIGRATIAGVHRLTGVMDDREVVIHRFQGVSLPVGFIINHMAYGILEKRAKKLNRARSPFESFNMESESHVRAVA